MKNQGVPVLVVITLVFAGIVLGLYLGRNASKEIHVSVAKAMYTVPQEVTVPDSDTASPININTATKEELMTLPGIGEDLAQRILDYRRAVVLFSAAEELINVNGIGTKLLEEILPLITIGG